MSSAITQPERAARRTTTSIATTTSKRRLSSQSAPGEHRRAQLEERQRLPRHVLAALDQELGRPRRDPHLDPAPVGGLDDLEQLRLVESPASATISSSSCVVAERGLDGGARRDVADELVVDAAAARPERRAQVRHLLGVADEQHAPADAERAQQRSASPSRRLQRRRLIVIATVDRCGEVEAEGREVLAGADREGERERGHEHDRGDDPARRPRAARAGRRGGCARRRAAGAGSGTASQSVS